jgi:hypothetical protein
MFGSGTSFCAMPVGCGQTVTSDSGGRVTVEAGGVVKVVVISSVVVMTKDVTIVSLAGSELINTALYGAELIRTALAAEPNTATARIVLGECISFTAARWNEWENSQV